MRSPGLKLRGCDKIGQYFTRYAQAPHWRYELGAVDGRPAMLVFDANGTTEMPMPAAGLPSMVKIWL